MTQETTNHATPAAWRETLYLAAINCSHSITHDSIVLHRDPAKDGGALAQMADRLAAEAVPGGAAEQSGRVDERSDREIMLEWDQHYKSGLTNGTPFLSIIVNFARATARAAVAAHLAGQSRATKVQAEPIYQVKSLIHSEFWHDTDWHSYEWNKENKQKVRIVYAAPTAQEVTQQAAKAGAQARCLNIAGQCRATATSDIARNVMVDAGSGTLRDLLLDAADALEGMSLAPTTSTVSAPEEVRNQALNSIANDGLDARQCMELARRALRTTDKGEAA